MIKKFIIILILLFSFINYAQSGVIKKMIFSHKPNVYLLDTIADCFYAFSPYKLKKNANIYATLITNGGITEFDVFLYEDPTTRIDGNSMCSNGDTVDENVITYGVLYTKIIHDQSGNGNNLEQLSGGTFPQFYPAFFRNDNASVYCNADRLDNVNTTMSEMDSGNDFQIISITNLQNLEDICIDFTTAITYAATSIIGYNDTHTVAPNASSRILTDVSTYSIDMSSIISQRSKINTYVINGSTKKLEKWVNGVQDPDNDYLGNYGNTQFRIGMVDGSNVAMMLGDYWEQIAFTSQSSNILSIANSRNLLYNVY